MSVSKSDIKFVRSLQQKKYRDESGCFVAEGEKCVGELMGHFAVRMLFRVEDVTAVQLEQLSSLRSPNGPVAVFYQRREPLPVPADVSDKLVLVLDGIQDPGNLGTIIRTADWFGVRHVICSADTADCYNPKVVQSTMGALARVHVYYTDIVDFISDYKMSNPHLPVYGTLLEGRDMYDTGAIVRDDASCVGIVVMGNEGKGISQTVRQLVTHPLRIPSFPKGEPTSESLNVAIATAVTLAELRRPV